MKAERRLKCETVTIELEVQVESKDGRLITAVHPFAVSLTYSQKTGELREIVFVGRGKIGRGFDLLFHDLGIKLSRAIQGRDPQTGLAFPCP